ncbi:MAG: protein kinase [Mariprofundaceae bacterium]|nr:protein kinase [Mariprofundaceae bacterium]
MQCFNCGTWYKDTQAFCLLCGNILSKDGAPPKLGNYRLLERIGEGGSGMVFRAMDEKHGTEVAIKVLHRHLVGNVQQMERFRLEAAAQSKLKHPSVLSLLDVYEQNGIMALVTELLLGCTLKLYINHHGIPRIGCIITIGTAILAGLCKAHEIGMVHRDLKLSNIFITDGGTLKLMDFGLAKLHKESDHANGSNGLIGSYYYMAPEQVVGEETSPKTDLYALGVILYRIATGHFPFTAAGGGEFEVLQKQLSLSPVHPAEINPNIHPELATLICTLLEKKPEERPQNCQVVQQQLQAIAPEEPLSLIGEREIESFSNLKALGEVFIDTTVGDDTSDHTKTYARESLLWSFHNASPEAVPDYYAVDMCNLPSLHPKTLQGLRSRIANIPQLPVIWRKLYDMFDDATASTADFADFIDKYQDLSERILATVQGNDSLENIEKNKKDPSNAEKMALAFTMMGINAAHDVILQCLFSVFDEENNPREMQHQWFHVRAVAMFARTLASYSTVVDVQAISTFAMLHDIGKIAIIHIESPARLQRLAEEIARGTPGPQAEWEVLGYTHIDVGTMLALHWRLPRTIHRFIYFHHHPCWHSPETWPADVQTSIMLVHLAHILISDMQMDDPRDAIWHKKLRTHVKDSRALMKKPLKLPTKDSSLYKRLHEDLSRLKLQFPDIY